jgi:hypothetical protein
MPLTCHRIVLKTAEHSPLDREGEGAELFEVKKVQLF